MPAPAKTRQELLQAAARLLEWNLVTADTGRAFLITKAQQYRLLHSADSAYVSCIKNHYRGPNAMSRLWEDVLRHARAGDIEMSDYAQSRLTRVLAGTRPELAEVLAGVDLGVSCQGRDRTARLREAVDALARRSERASPARMLAARTLPTPAPLTLESAVLGWVVIFEACLAPEPDAPAAPLPPDRAEVALDALQRGSACDEAYRRAGTRSRPGYPSRHAGGTCGAGAWVAARAVLAVAEHSGDPLTVARAWALEHDEWLRPRDEVRLWARIVRALFENGRTADALRALESACLRDDVPAPELADVAVDLCTALLALGEQEGAERALPPVVRARLDDPDLAGSAPGFDPALSDALRQALVDPRLGLTALRRVWFATCRDEPPDSATGWLVAGALARCLRESGSPSEAGVVAILSRRMLGEPGNEQEQRMRSALVATGSLVADEDTEAERQRLYGLLDELESLLLRAPQLASDERIVRELAGISRVARRARVLFRPERVSLIERTSTSWRR